MRVLVTGLGRRGREAVIQLATRGFTLVRGLRIDQLNSFGDDSPDVVLLECDTVGEVEIQYCRRLRDVLDVPIVAITRRADTAAWLRGHEAGIDDFLVDPFTLDELAARLRIAVRPGNATVPETRRDIVYGPLRINEMSRTVSVLGQRVSLRPKEYQLLVALARRPGSALRRDQLINRLWPAGWEGAQRALEVHIASLRAKLAVPGLIATVRGVGYRLISQESYLRLQSDD